MRRTGDEVWVVENLPRRGWVTCSDCGGTGKLWLVRQNLSPVMNDQDQHVYCACNPCRGYGSVKEIGPDEWQAWGPTTIWNVEEYQLHHGQPGVIRYQVWQDGGRRYTVRRPEDLFDDEASALAEVERRKNL